MTYLTTSSALGLAQAIRTGRITARAVVEQFDKHIVNANPRVKAFTTRTQRRAAAEAEAIDEAINLGRPVGPLAGVPFAVKNLFDVKGIPTLAGSLIRKTAPAAAQDAVIIQRLKAAGAILLGALNMDEFAYGFVTENQHYGPTRNPHDLSRIAGGSSGGSAAAVAAGMAPFSLGTDTNGSIRVPAALCGVFGLKPTYGRLPRTGAFFLSPSLDCVGPYARNVRDLAAIYDVLQRPEPGEHIDDAAHVGKPFEATATQLATQLLDGLDELRIGMLGGYFEDYADADAREAVAKVASAFPKTSAVEWEMAEEARAAAFVITASESGNLHLDNLRKRPNDYDIATRGRLIANVFTPASWYVQAQRFRRKFVADVLQLFNEVDILLAPATPCAAVPINTPNINLKGADMPTRAAMGILTQPISLVGLPVVTVPLQRPDGLPLGVQIIGAPWRELDCLRVAAYLERKGIASAPVAKGFVEG